MPGSKIPETGVMQNVESLKLKFWQDFQKWAADKKMLKILNVTGILT